jgi:hypothetical protein
MPPAIAHFESDTDHQGLWRDAMRIRTTEASQKEYPEAEMTTAATPDRRASCHSKNIPEAWREMISGFPNPTLAIERPKRENPYDPSTTPASDSLRGTPSIKRAAYERQAKLDSNYNNNMKTVIILVFAALAVMRSFAGVVFSDNFDDNSIDQTKWTTSGNTVVESGGIMQVQSTATDQWGILTSRSIPINPSGIITITRKVQLHDQTYSYGWGGTHHFMGEFWLNCGNLAPVVIRYYNMDYNAPPNYISQHGFYICRNGANPHNPNYQGYNSSDVSSMISPLWDNWFKETIVYNPQSGNLAYFINDVIQTTFNVGIMPVTASPSLVLGFNPAAWWTGHYQDMDDLVVTQGSTAFLSFYHQSGGALGAAGEGHSFVALTNKNGSSLFAGFYCDDYQYYFANVPEIGFSGYINDDQNTAWDYKISYPITDAQYKSALAVIAHDTQSPPRYWLIGFNCMDWVAKVATAAGIQLPQYKYLLAGVADPLIFYTSLSAMGNGTTYMGGTVTSNNASLVRFLSTYSTVTTPVDYSYSGLEKAGHADPSALATSIGIPYDHVNLGTVNANNVNGLSLTLAGADANHDVISIKWGDGSSPQEQSLSLSHVYATGTYAAQLLVIDAGAVHSYDMSVVVSSSTAATVAANVTPLAPVSIPNQGFVPASLGPDFLVLQTTSISVLANSHVLVTFLGIPTLTYTIEATADLKQGFLPVATVTAGSDGTFQYDDPAAVGAKSRFYRATYP